MQIKYSSVGSAMLFFLALPLFSQVGLKTNLRSECYFGGGASDVILSTIEDYEGNLVSVGYSEKGSSGGRDIFFLKVDSDLELLKKKHIGRRKNDGANEIILDIDGQYVIVGYSEEPEKNPTTNKYYGAKDGWVLWVNERGIPQKELLLGSKEDDEWIKIIPQFPGGYFLIGNQGPKSWVAKIDLDGNLLWEETYQISQKTTRLNDGIILNGKKIVLLGHTIDRNKQQTWIMELTLDGAKMKEQVFSEHIITQGHELATLKEQIIIGGYVKSNRRGESGTVLLLDDQYTVQKYEYFGGKEYDRIQSIRSIASSKTILAVGFGKSFKRGARRDKGWTVSYDIETGEKAEYYYGSKLDDRWYELIQRSNGSFYATGASQKKILKSDEAWIGQLSPRMKESYKSSILQCAITSGPITSTRHLEKNIDFLQVDLTKIIDKPIYHLEAKLMDGKTQTSLRTFVLPPIIEPKTSIYLPITLSSLSSNKNIQELQLILSSRDTSFAHIRFNYEIEQDEELVPDLSIVNIRPGAKIYKDSLWQMDITIKNTGSKEANNVFFQVIGNNELLEFPSQMDVGMLLPNEQRTKSIIIEAKSSLKSSIAAKFTIRTLDDTYSSTDTASFTLNLSSSRPHLGEPIYQEGKKEKYILATWLNPNPDLFERDEIVHLEEIIDLQVKVVSSHPLNIGNYCLELNGQPCMEGAKMDEVRITGKGKGRTFVQKLVLKEGKNQFKVVINNEAGIAETTAITVVRPVKKPNLHLLSIGVPSVDLSYTAKDALDFATFFYDGPFSKKNMAFGHVFCDTLISKHSTQKTEILKTLKRLEYRALDNQINANDLIILFISSHGLSDQDGTFRIAASDYDSPFIEETSLDFSEEVIQYLAKLPGRKLVFIDACHSGLFSGADHDDFLHKSYTAAQVIESTAFKQKGINYIMSCQANEYSYEDKLWENGAFTEGILEAFTTFYHTPQEVDLNQNNQLVVEELFAYLKNRVPKLVAKKRPKAHTTQTPLLQLNENTATPFVLIDFQSN